jgi:hypothetical protein
MSYWKSDGTAMKLWEEECGIPGPAYIRAVPGGWIVRDAYSDGAGSAYVPDPTAPHCQPTPPEDDRPPMTDDALAKWCDTVLGQPEPVSTDRNGARWHHGDSFVYYELDQPSDERWAVPWCDYGLPASIAGPALWAAHRYGTP